jgi:signal transduction histidine kinase
MAASAGTSWRATLLDGVVGLFLLMAATPTVARSGSWSAPIFALFALLALPLAVRRRYPVPVFALVSAAALVQWLTIPRIGPYDLAVLVALYSVSAYAGRRWSLAALAICLAGSVMAWSTERALRPVTLLGLIPPLAVVVAVWLVGRNLRTRRRYLGELEERAVRLERERDALARAAVAEERARIAREMHDVVAHTVAVMVAQAEGASVAIRTAPDQAERALGVISDAGRDALAELRRMLGVLRDPAATPPGGPPQTAPQPGIGDLDALVASIRASGLPVRFVRDGGDAPLDPTLGLAVYRIVQESLTNTLKHCGPNTPTEVRLRRSADLVEVEVTDRGRPSIAPGAAGTGARTPHHATPTPHPGTPHPGTPHPGTPTPHPGTPGHGLTGMRERVAVFAGRLSAGPTPTGGWRVHAELPTRGAP